MAKDPDDRYQSGESLLGDLRRLAAQPEAVFRVAAGRRARPPTAPQRPDRPGRGGRHAGQPLAAGPRRRRRGGHRRRAGRRGQEPAGPRADNGGRTDGDLVLHGKCVPDDPVPLAPLRAAVERYLRTVERLPAGRAGPAPSSGCAGRPAAAARCCARCRRCWPTWCRRRTIGEPTGTSSSSTPWRRSWSAWPTSGRARSCTSTTCSGWTSRPGGCCSRLTSRLPVTRCWWWRPSRDDAETSAALDRFGADMDATLDTRVQLRSARAGCGGPTGQPSTWAGCGCRTDTSSELVDAGRRQPVHRRRVRPRGPRRRAGHAVVGRLAARPGRADRLELSGDAVDLVLQRIDGLGAESRRLLAAGAASGRWFPTELVAAVCDIDPRRARALLAEAESRRLVTARGTDGYRFLHDRIREALLVGLRRGRAARLHQRIAEVLEAAGARRSPLRVRDRPALRARRDRPPAGAGVRQRPRGRPTRADRPRPGRGPRVPGGRRPRRPRVAGITPPPDFFLALGTSCARVGAVRRGPAPPGPGAARRDATRSAGPRILAQAAMVHTSAWNPDQAFDAVCHGLAELGRPLPQGRLGLGADHAGRWSGGWSSGGPGSVSAAPAAGRASATAGGRPVTSPRRACRCGCTGACARS